MAKKRDFHMKINKLLIVFLIILIFPLTIAAKVSYPKPTAFANDFAGVLSSEALQKVNNISIELKQKTSFELSLAIVEDMQGEDYYTYATKLYEKWGIGGKNDAGTLLLIAVKERKMKIETGYGAEGFLPDGLCGEIADKYIVPYLNKNDYNSGVLNGVAVIATITAQHYGVQLTGIPEGYGVARSSSGINIIRLIFVLLILSLFLGGRIGLLPLLFLGSMGGMRGGWGSGAGGFGGFGGFGGGLSGGGGIGRSF
jgi:uncharacterized protein